MTITEGGTTSGVTGFSINRNDIIYMALEDLGVYAPDFENPTPGEITRASQRLNLMIRDWQARGVGLWLNTVYTQVLTASTQVYLLGPDADPAAIARPLNVTEARLVNTAGNETPMTKMSRDDYMMLPIKSSTGPPNQYYTDPQLDNLYMYVWPVAVTLTDVIKMTLRMPIQSFVNINDAPDFPLEWMDALHFNLAMRLVPAYKVPPQTANDIKEQAGITLATADSFDRELDCSVQMVPDFLEY